MSYSSLHACILDLERHGRLVRVAEPVDPDLEMAAIQRRLYAAGGPAVLFERVRNSRFPALCNLFGTLERARFIFRETLDRVRAVIDAKADPERVLRQPWRYLGLPATAWRALPLQVGGGPVLANRCRLSDLPQIRAWPRDGGAFITLPQVYTEDPDRPDVMRSNLGMYRVQLAGNDYRPDVEVGLHYQIHRGIGVHHAAAIRRGEALRVSVFVGGPPAHTLAAVMPLPEGLSELVFAGMLARRRFRYHRRNRHVFATDADFCLVGTVDPSRTAPEGPFGDHLGYYSLVHEFPVMNVEAVYHREDAIWPFTVVGRPPQEDTVFGALIHELTASMVPAVIPGLRQMHAVDAAGVHPLLLAVGSERYVPYGEREPQELLTIANAVLGFGQASLAKYLMIAAGEDDPSLDPNDIAAFFQHLLARIDLRRDLHFHTRTTIDTLDYSGHGLNRGSKLVMAAAGRPCRTLATAAPRNVILPPGFGPVRLPLPGVLALGGPAYGDVLQGGTAMEAVAEHLAADARFASPTTSFPLIVVCDDPDFVGDDLANFLWVTFTRSNPAVDVSGVGMSNMDKHWGCRGSLLIDARTKPHHAPPLEEDPEVARRIERLAAPGGPLHGIL